MRVKIGKRWFDPKVGQPIMLVLDEYDRSCIAKLQGEEEEQKIAFFHVDEKMSVEEKEDWMDDPVQI